MNPWKKCNRNAWISKYDYGKNVKKLESPIPILGVRNVETYSDTLLDVLWRWWDGSFCLKPLGTLFSVSKILGKSASFFLCLWRSWEFSRIRFAFYTYVWMIRSKNLVKKIHELMNQYLIFMALVFNLFMHICHQIMSNYLQFFPNLICTKSWRYFMHKKIQNIRVSIFLPI